MEIIEKSCTKWDLPDPLPPPMNENESVNDFDIYPPWWTNEHNERRG